MDKIIKALLRTKELVFFFLIQSRNMFGRPAKIIISIGFVLFLSILFKNQVSYPGILFSNDFYGYVELGKNIFNEFNFLVRWELDNLLEYPPLFSILIYILTTFTNICPVQSGKDRILKLMNRGHNIFQLEDALIKIKNLCPKLKLFTTVIVGFPSESETEFEETLNFIQKINFELVYIFGYSKNPFLTNSQIMSQETPEDIIKIRTNKAIKFCKKNRIACAIA